MPYFFPYEDIFVYTIATLIVGLLYMRVRLARARRAHAESQPGLSLRELCTFCATSVANSHGCAITGNPRSKPFSRKRGTWVWAAEG